MSVKLTSIVLDEFLAAPGLKVLAICLADAANDDGFIVQVPIATLVKRTNQSERTIQYQLRSLESMGLITTIQEGRGRGVCTVWQLNIEKVQKVQKVQKEVSPLTSPLPLPQSPSPSPHLYPPSRKARDAPLSSEDFHKTLPMEEWNKWIEVRKANRFPCNPACLRLHLGKLKHHNVDVQREMIQNSIDGNWRGLFPLKSTQQPKKRDDSRLFQMMED